MASERSSAAGARAQMTLSSSDTLRPSAHTLSQRSTSKRILPATRLRASSSPSASSPMRPSPQITAMIPMRSRRPQPVRALRQKRAPPQGAAALIAVSQGHPLAGLPPLPQRRLAASSGSSAAKNSQCCGGLTLPCLSYYSVTVHSRFVPIRISIKM